MIRKIQEYISACQTASGLSTGVTSTALKLLISRLRYGIGPHFFLLFRLYERPMTEWRTFVLDTESNPCLRQMNKSGYSLARDKVIFVEHCLMNNLAAAKGLMVIPGAKESGTSIKQVTTAAEFAEIVSYLDTSELFLKPIDGTHGGGAFAAFRQEDGRWRFHERVGTSTELFLTIKASIGNSQGFLVQKRIKPHRALEQIMPKACGTVRGVTYLTPEGPKLLFPLLKIPAGKNDTDNFKEGETGNLVAPIDAETGTLGPAWRRRDLKVPVLSTTDSHPDTSAQITGLVVPYWQETRELILKGQLATPKLKTIGWDVALCDEGPVIIEANSAYDITILELAYSRGLREPMRSVIDQLK
jgi:hypothetical protein